MKNILIITASILISALSAAGFEYPECSVNSMPVMVDASSAGGAPASDTEILPHRKPCASFIIYDPSGKHIQASLSFCSADSSDKASSARELISKAQEGALVMITCNPSAGVIDESFYLLFENLGSKLCRNMPAKKSWIMIFKQADSSFGVYEMWE